MAIQTTLRNIQKKRNIQNNFIMDIGSDKHGTVTKCVKICANNKLKVTLVQMIKSMENNSQNMEKVHQSMRRVSDHKFNKKYKIHLGQFAIRTNKCLEDQKTVKNHLGGNT